MFLSPTEQQQFLAYWTNWRRRGQVQYLLFESLVFGVAAAAVGTFLITWMESGLAWQPLAAAFSNRGFFVLCVALTLSGLLHGLYSWRANQRRYRELTEE